MLHPFLLWFLPLAAVPLVLHLITLYRLRTIELSTFRFLMESYIQQRRRMKLLEWLLMLLRTAFVALIVLSLTRPIAERYGFLFGGSSSKDVVLIVDAGVTSGLQTAGSTALKRAKEAASVVAQKLAPQDYVTLIRAGSRPELLYRGYLTEDQELLRKIDGIGPDIASTDLPAALAEAESESPHGPRVIYFISDMQRRSWQRLADHPAVHDLEHDVQLVVMNVGNDEKVENLALLGEPPRAQRPIVDFPVLLRAKVAASHRDQPVSTKVSVVLDEQVVGNLNLTIQPGRPATAAMAITPKKAGVLRGHFELPPDAFPDDNKYDFCLNVEPHIRVLLITQPGDGPLEDPAIYLKAALASPLLARGSASEQDQNIAKSLLVTAIRSDQFNESHLEKTDVIVAADMAMDDNRGSLLRKHVERGGGLLVMAGPHVDPGRYQGGLFNATSPPGTNTPLVRYEGPTGNPDDESTFQPITFVDNQHPALSQFEAGEIDYFGTARLYRYLPLTLGNAQAPAKPAGSTAAPKSGHGVQTLMKLANQSPAMVETGLGTGRMLVCSFAATPGWSNLPTRALFVPLLLRSIAYLRPAAGVEAVAAVRPHEPAPIRLSQQWQGGRVEATMPNGHIQPIELHTAEGRLIGALLTTDQRGYYSFRAQPPASLANQASEERGFAVNLDIDGADFASIGQDRVSQIFAGRPLSYLVGNPSDPVLAAQLHERHEIWRWLIWGMFLLIAVEFLLATLRSAVDDKKRSVGNLQSQLGASPSPPPRTRPTLGHSSEPLLGLKKGSLPGAQFERLKPRRN